jgi:hypothetical protein
MTTADAIKALTPYRQRRICDVYDDVPEVAEAITALLPTFEYPDWSHYTVAFFVRNVDRVRGGRETR